MSDSRKTRNKRPAAAIASNVPKGTDSQPTRPKASRKTEDFEKSYDPGHGTRFQSNLVAIYMIRAVNKNYYDFQLGTEIKGHKDCKFDDLVFRYKKTSMDSQWSYHFLQAKHSLDVEKSTLITALQLSQTNPSKWNTGDFSLPKYFWSYLDMNEKELIKYCIIFTNLGLNLKILSDTTEDRKIELIELNDSDIKEEIFYLIENSTKQVCYKFKVTATLYQSAKEWFKSYNTINSDSHYKDSSSDEIKEHIVTFFEKLVFTVDTPNENQLNERLTKEFSQYFNFPEDISQPFSALITSKLVKWFALKENKWLTKENARATFLNKAKYVKELVDFIAISVNYRDELMRWIEFNPETINNDFKNHLTQFQQIRITSTTKEFTAAKTISVLESSSYSYKCGDGYLIIQSSRDDNQLRKLTKLLSDPSNSFSFIIVVEKEECAIDTFCDKLLTPNSDIKIISIGSNDKRDNVLEDKIVFGDLNQKTKEIILSKSILFQGRMKTVRKLIDETQLENIIDPSSIQELLKNDTTEIADLNSTYYSEPLEMYISRRIRFPYKLDVKFWNELSQLADKTVQSKCNVGEKGNIEWLETDDNKKLQIWQNMKEILSERRHFNVPEPFKESELTNQDNKQRIVILTGVAGTGKTTILSSLHQEIVRTWDQTPMIIRLNFTDTQVKVLLNQGSFSNQTIVDRLLTNNVLIPSSNSSQFTRMLIRHRLETGGGIVLLMDAFDEISGQLQRAATELIKTILTTKADRIYVTTRAHVKDLLEDNLYQFAYTLESFSLEEQVQYLSRYWEAHLEIIPTLPKALSIPSVAELLVKRVLETLIDEEKAFIGIPLQCRILAECFSLKLKDIVEKGRVSPSVQNNIIEQGDNQQEFKYNIRKINKQLKKLIKCQNFDLVSLYEQSMDVKNQIFSQKRATKLGYQIESHNKPNDEILLSTIYKYHLQLAIEAIISDKSEVDILLPPSPDFDTDAEKETWEKSLIENSLIYGLTTKINVTDDEDAADTTYKQQLRFIHRTYAEFLMAKYVYKGFRLNDKEANKLLTKSKTRKIIVESILVLDEYDGVRRFLDSMLYTIINDQNEWYKMKNLPLRFQDMSREMLARSDKSCGWGFQNEVLPHILSRAVEEKYGNIFKLFNDCVEITWPESDFKRAMYDTFQSVTPSFADQSGLVIQQFMNNGYLLDSTEDLVKHMGRILTCMPPNTGHTKSKHSATWTESSTFEFGSDWNYEKTKTFVERGINFLRSSRIKNSTDIVKRNSSLCSDTIHFFLWNKYYPNKFCLRFLKLLLTLCDDKSTLIEILKYSLEKYHDNEKYPGKIPPKGRLEITLGMLRKRNEYEILKAITNQVLMTDRKIFQKFYLQFDKSEEKDWMKVSLQTNSFQITFLHKMAFDGQLKNLERICSSNNSSDAGEVTRIFMDSSLNPLYVAAICGNKSVFHLMLSFLDRDRLLQDLTDNRSNTFLFKAFLYAIQYEKIDTFKLMLNAVKQILGVEVLIGLFKFHPTEWSPSSPVLKGVCRNNQLLSSMIQVLTVNSTYYHDLNELLFEIEGWIFVLNELLQQTENWKETEFLLQKSFDANGDFVIWLKRLLDVDLDGGFWLLTQVFFLDFLTTNNLMSDLISTIIYSDDGDNLPSYWEKSFQTTDANNCWYNMISLDPYSHLERFLKCVKHLFGEEKLKELVTLNQGFFITEILLENRKGVFKVLLNHLSQTNQEVIAQIFNNLPEVIECRTWRETWREIWREFNNVLWFLSKYDVDTSQLEEIIEVITIIDDYHTSIWSEYADQCNYSYFSKGDDWSVFSEEFGDDEDEYNNQGTYIFLERINFFFELVSEKLGEKQEIIKKLVTNEYNGKTVIQHAANNRNHKLVILLLEYLCEADQEEVYQRLNESGYTLPETPFIWL